VREEGRGRGKREKGRGKREERRGKRKEGKREEGRRRRGRGTYQTTKLEIAHDDRNFRARDN
jgi:hypothetical protein